MDQRLRTPKFILIDHSLERVGGHHYEYSVHILHAAEAAGFDVALAANRRFRPDKGLPEHWPIASLFRNDMYCQHAIVGNFPLGPTDSLPVEAGPPNWRDRWREAIARRDRQRRIDHFAECCKQLLDRIEPQAGDHVFLTTMSDFDLLGLVEYLESVPSTQLLNWHLQFHFTILGGRSPEYARQNRRLEAMRSHFDDALKRVPNHRLHFYNTVKEISEQYNLLGVADFQELPYPINPEIRPQESSGSSREPLKVTAAGHIRGEKGRTGLKHLAHELWSDYLQPGKAQLCIQGSPRKFRGMLPEKTSQPAHRSDPPVAFIRHPLPLDEYARLIRETDIGLFLYDSDRYYARCSGILVEMLSAGVPIIVPAGCWLSDQIAEQVHQHVDHLVATKPAVGVERFREITCGDGSSSHQLELPAPADATDLVVSFSWLAPLKSGTYLRLTANQLDAMGSPLPSYATVVGHRETTDRVSALLRVRGGATQIQLELSNAYHDGEIVLSDLETRFLASTNQGGGSEPAGRVGLIAADREHFAEHLKDVIEHYAHYRETALEFSRHWRRFHDPSNAISTMIEKSERWQEATHVEQVDSHYSVQGRTA